MIKAHEKPVKEAVYYSAADCSIAAFSALVMQRTELADCPRAARIEKNVPIYDGAFVRASAEGAEKQALMAEWVRVLTDGPGIVAIKGAIADDDAIDQASEIFFALIEEQHRTKSGGGDHFAKPGANDRVWNALEKLCLADPAVFARYYSSPAIALISEAWLGPAYQITSQLNVVNPGGAAQTAHRDYHLGFQGPGEIVRYPAHVHHLSPFLTLQGAVAHCDMPLESGPTLYLPYSQLYGPGYIATGQSDFKDYFATHHVQLALQKGDAVFFNPALFHAAGNNQSANIKRMANLLQVSSAFGRAMESVDRQKMSAVLYPVLLDMFAGGTLTMGDAERIVASAAEGYAFPTNLDRDPPVGGLAPQSQQGLVLEALVQKLGVAEFLERLKAHAERRLS